MENTLKKKAAKKVILLVARPLSPRGGGKALLAGPLKKYPLFAASPYGKTLFFCFESML